MQMFKIDHLNLSSRACRPRVAKASASGAGISTLAIIHRMRFLDKLEMTKKQIFNFEH